MYIESRFFDNGTAKARMHQERPSIKTSDKYDTYLDKYNTFEEWFDDLEECDDCKSQMIADLEAGKWVNITDYC